jgi:hypothetical protein
MNLAKKLISQQPFSISLCVTPLPGLFQVQAFAFHYFPTPAALPLRPGPKTSPKAFSKNRRRREKWLGRVVSVRRRTLPGRSLKIPFPPSFPAPAYPGRGEFRCKRRNKRCCKN